MDTSSLRQRLGDILREEESAEVDWERVERMCDTLAQDLRREPICIVPHIVFHFLSDCDLRAKDDVYGCEQRIEIRRFVETGECDDIKPVEPWGCLAGLAAVAAALYWLFG